MVASSVHMIDVVFRIKLLFILQETSSELQVQSQCHLDDKRQLESLLTETQKHLGECARSLAHTEKLLAEEKNLRAKEV